MRAWRRVPRGGRRDRLAGGEQQSLGQDIERSIAVRVIFMAARDAGEDRLAIAVRRVRMAAGTALLRGEPRIDEDNPDAGSFALLLDPLAERSPGRGEDPAAQTGLGAGSVGQEGTRLIRVGIQPHLGTWTSPQRRLMRLTLVSRIAKPWVLPLPR